MPVDVVLNELSFRISALNQFEARRRMTTLMDTLGEVEQQAGTIDLHFHEEVYGSCLTRDYFLEQWLKDPLVDRDEVRRFLGYEKKTPLFMGQPELKNRQFSLEYSWGGQEAVGLGAADQLDGLPVSMSSAPQWEFAHIEVSLTELPDVNQSQIREILHASVASHVREHEQWFFSQQRDSVRRGKDLWTQKYDLYSNLIFCDNVVDHLKTLTTGDPKLNQIIRRLRKLDTYCKNAGNWTNGDFDKSKVGMFCRTESERTLQEYGYQREFKCWDGAVRLFDWHADVPPNDWRLHFFPLPKSRQIIIGYIGPHLDIASDPT